MAVREDDALASQNRPRVGLLGIMQELYDDMIPGITDTQGAYARKIVDQLEEGVDVTFEGPARNRQDIERQMRAFNEEGLDGVILVMLTYGPAMRTVRALSENDLPVMLANVQPERTITEDWDMADLTYNQGVHGAQDLANTLTRMGVHFPVISEDWRSDRFRTFVEDWVHAARAERSMQDMRIAQFGQMPGMGDIATDEAGFMRTLGPQVDRLSMGLIEERMHEVSDEAVAAAVRDDTVLVSVMHANNETGVMNPIADIAEVCHEHDVLLHCDAVQTAGLFDLDVKALGVDLLSMSGHKFYGPKGVGVLYVRGGVELDPLVEGGSQERKRRGGTENVAAVVGLAEALERASEVASERRGWLETLQRRMVEQLREALGETFVLNTPLDEASVAPHVVNVAFPPLDGQPMDGEMLILSLDMAGVQASAGSACTSGALEPSHVLAALGLPRKTASAAVRFSMGKDTTADDVDYAIETLESVVQRMRRKERAVH